MTIIKATHEGKIKLGETELPVAVLEDGTRILSRNAVFKAFGRTQRGRKVGENREPNMPSFIDAKRLQPFIDEGLRGELQKMEYLSIVGKQIDGFKSDILPKLCKVYIEARAKGVLKSQQMPLARASEILLLCLAETGINELIDQATGYAKERPAGRVEQQFQESIQKQLAPESTAIAPAQTPTNMFDIMRFSLDTLQSHHNRIGNVESAVKMLEAKSTTRPEYFTVAGYAAVIGIKKCGIKLAVEVGRKATALCHKNGYAIDKVSDPRFGYVNAYPKHVLEELFRDHKEAA